jgi:hypothetical protein
MPKRKTSSKRGRAPRERGHRTAAQWLTRLTGEQGKDAIRLPPDFVLWVLAGLLAHLDRRGDVQLADLAEGALVHGGGLAVHDGTGWQTAGPAHEAALRAIAQAFADLDLRRGQRQDQGAWELLDQVADAYTALCVGMNPDGTEADRDVLDEEMGRLGRPDLRDASVRREFRTRVRRRVLRGALEQVARRELSTRATDRQARARADEIRRRLQRAGLLKLVGGSVPFISSEGA